MGPKNEIAVRSNVPVKELSWIDRMYQKLENMCVEVDKNPSMLIQETTKYMENQMNVVGTNVRKLCAELIQDLLPPSEVALKKNDATVGCIYDHTTPEKPKQKMVNKSWELTQGGDEAAVKHKDQGIVTDTTSATEDTICSGHTEMTTCCEDTGTETATVEEAMIQQDIEACEVKSASLCGMDAAQKAAEVCGHDDGSARRGDSSIGDFKKESTLSCDSKLTGGDVQELVLQEVTDFADESKLDTTAHEDPNKEEDQLEMFDFYAVQPEDEELEQAAHWFVSEDQRNIYRTTSSVGIFDGSLQTEGSTEDFESDWELL